MQWPESGAIIRLKGGAAVWPLGIILFLSSMAPQQNAPKIPVPFKIGPAPQFQIAPGQPGFNITADQMQAMQNAHVCYAIRSYIFERQDGNAPVLVKTMTCTPAAGSELRQVNRDHKVRLVPAVDRGNQ